MSFGVGDPGNMRMCAGMLEGEAARSTPPVPSAARGMDYVGPRVRELRDTGQYLRAALRENAAILRNEAGIVRMLADQVEREKAILEQRQREEEERRRAAERQRQRP